MKSVVAFLATWVTVVNVIRCAVKYPGDGFLGTETMRQWAYLDMIPCVTAAAILLVFSMWLVKKES